MTKGSLATQRSCKKDQRPDRYRASSLHGSQKKPGGKRNSEVPERQLSHRGEHPHAIGLKSGEEKKNQKRMTAKHSMLIR